MHRMKWRYIVYKVMAGTKVIFSPNDLLVLLSKRLFSSCIIPFEKNKITLFLASVILECLLADKCLAVTLCIKHWAPEHLQRYVTKYFEGKKINDLSLYTIIHPIELTSIQRWFNFMDVESTLLQCCEPAGHVNTSSYQINRFVGRNV